MTWLGAALAATAAATLTAGSFGENTYWLLSALLLAAAVAAVRSGPVSTFHSLLMGVFGFEAVGLTFYILAGDAGLRPEIANALKTSQPVAMTLAMSVIGLRALALIPIVRRATAISDRFFASKERLALRVLGRTVMIPNSVIARVGTISMVFLSQTIVLLQIQTLLVTSEFMNAMQALDGPRFWHMLLVVTPLWVIATLAVHMVNDMLAGLLNIRWRRSLSEGYVRRWIGTGAHYRMALAGLGTDNPDQRIQSDVDAFVDGGEGTAFGVVFLTFDVIRQFSAFLAYSIILWGLSAKIKPFGPDLVIPGLLFWAAVLYAAATTAGTILIGRRLIRLSYERQHFEADYRFGLARLREYGEPITLMSGNRTEVGIVDALFARVRANSRATIWVRARLTLFNMVVGTIGQKAPYLALGGLYIARQVQLGDLTQAAAAFGQVVATLNFVSARFSSLAALKSVIDRLTSFDAALDRTESEGGGTYRRCDGGTDLALTDATIRLPDGEIIARDVSVRFEAGQNVLITGPSGTGKSTLFRVLAGIWPYWEGTAILPAGATLLVLPQTSYLPVGTLRTAVCYPAPADAFTSEAVAAALTDAGLGHLADALDRDENWAQTLSGGERQRLAIARALLIAPDWLLLDEATSAMDMTLERQVYETLRQRLPKTTLISIGHRDSLVVHHARRIHVTREGHGLRFAPSTKAA